MKKLILIAVVLFSAAAVFARPHHSRGHHPAHRHHSHHHSFWGRGGRNFWPGFVGGLIGGAVSRTVVPPAPVVVQSAPVVVQSSPIVVAPPPVVVQQPVTQVQNVWVEGRYVDQVQANGVVIRTWQPGHYEQRTVVVQ